MGAFWNLWKYLYLPPTHPNIAISNIIELNRRLLYFIELAEFTNYIRIILKPQAIFSCMSCRFFPSPWRGREGRVASSNKHWIRSCRTRLPNTADLLLPWLPTCHHLTWPVASRASRVQTLLGVVMLCDIWNNTFIWNSCYNEEDIVCVREKCGYGACSCSDLLPHGGQSAVQVDIMENIPYGQSSAKLPDILSPSHLVIWSVN